MKTLAFPLCLILLFTACRKTEMPTPLDSSSALSNSRVHGDTALPIVNLPLGLHAPLLNERGPKNQMPDHSAFRVTGDFPPTDTLIDVHKPLGNGTGPKK